MLERLLDHWYSMEFFQPSWPINGKKDIKLNKTNLPWMQESPDPKIKNSYDVYLGRAIAYELIVWCFKSINQTEDDSRVERDPSKVCLCALKVDEKGCYVPDSFAVSSFVWALCTIVKARNFNVELKLGDIENLQNRFNNVLMDNEDPFTYDKLVSVFRQVCMDISVGAGTFVPEWWAVTKTQYIKMDGTFPKLEPSTELMSSFYLHDISLVRENPGKKIRQYVEALCGEPPKREMIDKDIHVMQKWLEAERFPLGTWPSAYSPSLMQQLAINLGISGQDVFSVNGPPGTGKTTLLKEVVASNIVRRAAVMAAYEKPDDAFEKCEFDTPPTEYLKTYYRPDKELTPYGVLVASNNNAAVENISIELPKMITKDRTGSFTNKDNVVDTYFTDIATALLGEPAWGLISTRLGKKDNLNEFRKCLWKGNDNYPLQQYYDAPPDWGIAKRKFLTALEAVKKEQSYIAGVQRSVSLHAGVIEKEQVEILETYKRRVATNDQYRLHLEQQSLLEKLEKTRSTQLQDADELKKSMPWIKRLLPRMFSKNPVVCEWKRISQAADETLIAIVRQRESQKTQTQAWEIAKQRFDQQEETLRKAKECRINAERLLEPAKARFAKNYADGAFWRSICENVDSQSACPWTDERYNTLREELFYRALMLQKAFVLNSNRVKQNLMRLCATWDGKFVPTDRESAYGSLLNTLFFVVPVISTTFASVKTFLDGVQQGELGVLVVDEAGQATPQSALGALWRTKTAIVVGDPLQVEPIVTTPRELCKRFADEYAIPTDYRIPELSVQMLADAQNLYGGFRTVSEKQLWLGCPLVVHRRCIEPMFSISNNVAYNGRMFCMTIPPTEEKVKHLLLDKSCWFDISGNEVGNKNHTVESQVDLAIDLVKKAIICAGGFPDIYIITPFVSVKYSLEQRLRPLMRTYFPDLKLDDLNDWIGDNCGTIHTFQGKEADEVILVLGCDNQKGMSAARWVGQKPNIINVAVSRAKFRIGVIGSYDLWHGIPHVCVVCDTLKDAVLSHINAD